MGWLVSNKSIAEIINTVIDVLLEGKKTSFLRFNNVKLWKLESLSPIAPEMLNALTEELCPLGHKSTHMADTDAHRADSHTWQTCTWQMHTQQTHKHSRPRYRKQTRTHSKHVQTKHADAANTAAHGKHACIADTHTKHTSTHSKHKKCMQQTYVHTANKHSNLPRANTCTHSTHNIQQTAHILTQQTTLPHSRHTHAQIHNTHRIRRVLTLLKQVHIVLKRRLCDMSCCLLSYLDTSANTLAWPCALWQKTDRSDYYKSGQPEAHSPWHALS